MNEPYCWLTDDPENEHTRRCESVLPILNEDVLQTLDDIALVCIDVLLPSVCRGQADEVRVFLNTLADGGTHSDARDAVEALKHSRQDGKSNGVLEDKDEDEAETERVVVDDNRKAAVQKYVSFICPLSELSLLMYAVLTKRPPLVRELLAWGADVHYEWKVKEGQGCESCVRTTKVSALLLALSPKGDPVKTLEILLEAGAEITPYILEEMEFCGFTEHLFLAVFNTLTKWMCDVPLKTVAVAIDNGLEDVSEFCCRHRVIYWSHHCLYEHKFIRIMKCQEHAHFLLKLPVNTREQKVYKSLFCQAALYSVITNSKLPANGPASVQLVSVLLEEGADVHGWSLVQTKVKFELWSLLCRRDRAVPLTIYSGYSNLKFKHNNEFYVHAEAGTFLLGWRSPHRPHLNCTCPGCVEIVCGKEHVDMTTSRSDRDVPETFWLHCMLPIVMRMKATGGNSDDDITQVLFAATCVPWLKSLSQIPVAKTSRNYIHDGPTCDHVDLTEEQRKVSLHMCTRSGSFVYGLQSSCRDVILSCLDLADIMDKVEKLPLPEALKDYLLC